MESQEMRVNAQQSVPSTLLNSLQMSVNGHLVSMADVAMYSNSIARLSDTGRGGLTFVGKCKDASVASVGGGSVALSRKCEDNCSEESFRNLKRRKENADGHGNYGMILQNAVDHSTAVQQQQTFAQHSLPPSYRMHSRLENTQLNNMHAAQQSPSHVYSEFEDANGHRQLQSQSQGNMEHRQNQALQRTSSDARSISETVFHNSNGPSFEAAGFSGNARLSLEHSHGHSSLPDEGGLSSSDIINSSSGSIHPSPSVNSQQNSVNISYSNGSQQLAIPLPVLSPEINNVSTKRLAVKEWGNRPLSMVDPQMHSILEREKVRQWKGIELIASENFTSQAVMEVLGSHLTNKYSEGLPGARYYGGNEYIDQIENLCRERALIAFHIDPDQWGVNVQPYSCTSANFAVYTALLQPKDRIMGLDSPSGGHLSHGYYTSSGKKVSAASIFFENLSYKVNPETGYVDYDKLEEKALDFRPKILICGGSAYPREWDYARFRQIADKIGAVLMCDMAHISGLVAAKECASPFDYCDIVTSTMHKSLRGPRGGIIFYRKGLKQRRRIPGNFTDDSEHYDFEDRVNFAVFPSLQGGPHNNQIAALAVALKQVATPEYKAYMQQVKKNAQALVAALQRRGCNLVTDGTDNHLLLWDLRPHGITGYRFEKVCELSHITVNKNAVYGDSGNFAPGGVRLGTLAMTSRGCVESDFEIIAEFLLRVLNIAIATQREQGKQQRDFLKTLQNSKDITDLRNSVERFASTLALPGFDMSSV